MVTYFFCKDNESQREAHQILRTFLYQLTADLPSIRPRIKQIWETQKSIANLTTTIEDLFDRLIPTIADIKGRVFLIIDGINECPRASVTGILKLLNLFRNAQQPDFRILVTSQPMPEINVALLGAKIATLVKNNNEDTIERFIRNTLDDVLTDHFRAAGVEPLDYFQTKHNGMFIWVSTVLEYLQQADCDEDFQEILRDVPDMITDLYQKRLQRLERDLSKTEKVWVKDILSWAVLAQ